MNQFWVFNQKQNQETGETENILILDGVIAEESWYGDEVTPQLFEADLKRCRGDITVYINSPGGDVFAAAQIYTALKEHSGSIHVKINGTAASAASVIAMSGDLIEMSPPAMMMIHNPSLMLYGEARELAQGIEFLNEVKESIINAYQLKSGLSRNRLSKMMDAETWLNARSAIEYGFCDRMLYSGDQTEPGTSMTFNKQTLLTNTIAKMRRCLQPIPKPEEQPAGESAEHLNKRLELLKEVTR